MTVGILGYGSFGQFLHTLAQAHVPDAQTKVWDRKSEPDAKTFFSFEEVCACDVLIFAVSISALEEIIARAVSHISANTVLVDVATVKLHAAALFKKYAEGRNYITTHPMFGPYSFAKEGNTLDGLRLVISEHTLHKSELEKIESFFEHAGLKVLHMNAQEHDRMLAETLFLTHYIGQTVSKAGFVRTDIDTLSFGYLMDAVESVRQDTKLFEEVFRFNSHCARTIERFEQAEKDVHARLAYNTRTDK